MQNRHARGGFGWLRRAWPVVAACGLAAVILGAARSRAGEPSPPTPAARLIASPEADWPQWRGPRRDGICDERGLLPAWAAEGPKLLWSTGGLGKGWVSPIITRGRLYLAGDVGDQLQVIALDLDGKVLWRSPNGKSWRDPFPGARASCAYSEGRVYHLNAHGRLGCFEAQTGQEVWALDVVERFEGQGLQWAISECLLVDGPRVLVTAGGKKGLVVALDKANGEPVWASPPLWARTPGPDASAGATPSSESMSYASPILVQFGPQRLLVNCSLRHLFCADADAGKLLWTHPMPTAYSVLAMTPVLVGDAVFMTAPDAQGGRLLRLRQGNPAAEGVKPVWTTPLDTCQGGVVHVDGHLYGSWYRGRKGLVCVAAATGEVQYQATDFPKASLLYAEGRLYGLCEDGEMLLWQPEPERFTVKGRFAVPEARSGDAWAHPVIHNRRLYVRHHQHLYCYDVKAPAPLDAGR